MGEFGLIDRIVELVGAAADPASVQVGPGDDAAVIATPDGRVVVCTDVLIEGRHFRRDWCSGADVGHRAAAANLADIAAMGATPTAITVGLACPPDLAISWVEQFSTGLRDECALTSASVIGGDISRAASIFISVTALGDLAGIAPVLRSGAAPGEVVALCGRVGFAAAGLAILMRGFRSGKEYIEAYRRPEPPYLEGPLAALAGASSMCDVSDGLIQDLGHIARASGVRIDLDRSAFEVPPRMGEIASALGQDPLSWLLGGGDDHALVATFGSASQVPADWRIIGEVLAPAQDPAQVTVNGGIPTVTGWDHFAAPT